MPTEETAASEASADEPIADPPSLPPVMTGPMPVVPAPGLTFSTSPAADTVSKVRPAPPARSNGMLFAAIGAAAVAAVVLVIVLISGAGGAKPAAGIAAAPAPDAAPAPVQPDPPPAPAPAASQMVEPSPALHDDTPIVPAELQEITLTITSRPAGSEVKVDGVVRGKTPLELRLPRSDERNKVEVRHRGFATFRETVTAERDRTLDVTLERRGKIAAEVAVEPPKPPDPPATAEVPSAQPKDLGEDRY
jgi:hypothetical protein